MTTRSLLSPHAAPDRTELPVLEKGFRPFFLVGAAFAVLAVPLWIIALKGGVQPGGAFGVLQWHAHEMLFGFSTAIIAGFLLTAVSNWSGRETVTGWPLAALSGLWVSGRAALFFASDLPRLLPLLVDVSFLPLLSIACGRALFAANNRRNYGFLGLLLGLALANAAAHGFALRGDLEAVRLAHRAGLNLILIMLVAMTGRVLPMFTRNATRLSWIRPLPLLERGSLATVVLLALCDLVPSANALSVALAALAAVLLLARMRFWGTLHVSRQPLLWILHVGTLFIPFGLALRVVSTFAPSVPPSSSLHALTAGAIGSLTLGMMARVSLGHTGRMLVPARSATWAMAFLVCAAVVRVAAPLLSGTRYLQALTVASALWSSAFLLFLFGYLKILLSPRADAR
ncbi:MAG TPA: NnrS family protein [Polyangiaceae bacterium]|nr:NnrS family protein [Polyangiaceae bacterium]